MPTEYTSSTFSEVYKDDYSDSAGFHKILFNSGRPLQARELTQLQTILHEQIRRFADNVFLDGAAIGASGTGLFCVSYVVVESIPTGYTAKDYVGVTLQGPPDTFTSGLQFEVIHAEDANATDDATLFGVYKSLNQAVTNEDQQDTHLDFGEGSLLRDLRVAFGLSGNADLTVKTQPGSSTLESTGRGLLFGIQSCHFWTNGHFVFAPEQLIAVSKYEGDADVDVGFEVTKDIVTETDDESLYDNQGVVPNLSSPGAHRFRIRLTLTTRESIVDESDFVYYASIRGGLVTQVKGGSESYNEIEQRMALRHFETNGNFEAVPFEIRHLPGDSEAVLNLRVPGMNTQGVVPTAYIDGYRLSHYNDEDFLIHKPVSTSAETDQNLTVEYKNYVIVPFDSDDKNYLGNVPSNFNMDTQTKLRLANVSGRTIGTTRVKHLVNTLDNKEGTRLHLYDVRMKSGFKFGDTHTILGDSDNCIGPANTTDAYATYEVDVVHIWASGARLNTDVAISFSDSVAEDFSTYFKSLGSGREFASGGLNYWMNSYESLIAAGTPQAQAIAITEINIRGSYEADPIYGPSAGGVVETLTFCNRQEGNAIVIRKEGDDDAYLKDPDISTSLHRIPGGRVKNITNVNMTTQRQFVATSSSNTLQITTGNNELFDDLSRWTFINTTLDSQEAVSPGSISLNSSIPQTATITVDGAAHDYKVYSYVEKNAPTPKSKTYTSQSSTITSSRVYDSSGDRFEFDLYDAIRVTDVRADSANGRDIKDLVSFDDGQRDNYYGPAVLKAEGLPYSITSIHAKFDYFDWGPTGDFFTVNSYVLNDSMSYSDIPIFRSPRDGKYYDLRNHLDFRPKLNSRTNDMAIADRFEIPRDGDNITYDVEWYNRRIDHVSLGYNQQDFSTEIRVNTGSESLNPEPPANKVNEMVLYKVEYRGNTFSVKDLIPTKFKHRRYTMEDVSRLEDRILDLEETVSLSLLEQDVVNLVELNTDGDVRSKTGFFVDEFRNGFDKSASEIEPFWIDDKIIQTQSLYRMSHGKKAVGPRSSREAIQMMFDSDDRYIGRTEVTKNNVVRKGDILYLDHTSVLDSSLSNELISWTTDGNYSDRGFFNVNPFDAFSGSGFLKLSPTTDMWYDNYHSPNRSSSKVSSDESQLRDLLPSRTSGTELESFKSTTRSYVYSSPDVLGEDVEVYAIPYSRQKEIFAKAQGLKPNTRYWPFFDGVNVEQWVISKTGVEYQTHLKNDDHLKTVPEVDVNVLQHPDKTFASDSILVTDVNGDLFFSFWLPNNASVPSSNSNSLNSYQEWELWITNQRKKSKQYDGPLDPRVYDDIGWKFRSGAIPFLLNDVSTTTTSGCQSSATTDYISSGSILLPEKTIHMTRPVTKRRPVYVQPIAQTFNVDGRKGIPGAFITKIDVFVRNAPRSAARGGLDAAIPLELQIREVENGTPAGYPAGEQYRVFKSANDVYDVVSNIANKEDIDDVLSNPVTFEFPEPVYLQANETYAMVLTSECNDYEVFASTAGDLVLGKTDLRVSNQPLVGRVFVSQNGQDWSAKSDVDMAYRIYTAKFKSSGSFNLYNEKFGKYNHNTNAMTVDQFNSSRFRVNHYNHGLGVGDKVDISGLNSSSTYLGVSASDIMDPSLTVDSADAAGYFVKLPSATFNTTGIFGEKGVSSNRAFNYDRATYNVESKEYPSTNILYEGNMVSGLSHAKIDLSRTADPRFDMTQTNTKFAANREMYYNKPKMLANPIQEMEEVGISTDSQPSIIFGTKFNTNSVSTFGGPSAAAAALNGYVADVSPIIDLQRSTMVMENSIIDNQLCGSGRQIEDQYAVYDVNQDMYWSNGDITYGMSLVNSTKTASAERINNHFRSSMNRDAEISGLQYWMGIVNREVANGFSEDSAVDITIGHINYDITTDPLTVARTPSIGVKSPDCEFSNIPQLYRAETLASSGSSPSKHITKPVTLNQASNGLRVFVDMFKPPAARFDLFYRVVADPEDDIYAQEFTLIKPQNEPEDNQFNPDTFDLQNLDFREYRYLIGDRDGNLPDFTKFQFKVVMRSTNTCEIPIMNSIRVAALI